MVGPYYKYGKSFGPLFQYRSFINSASGKINIYGAEFIPVAFAVTAEMKEAEKYQYYQQCGNCMPERFDHPGEKFCCQFQNCSNKFKNTIHNFFLSCRLVESLYTYCIEKTFSDSMMKNVSKKRGKKTGQGRL